MPGEELCHICQKPHPTGFCVESEKNIFSKVDPLFERVHHLEEAPEIPEGLSKKEVAAISMPERITAEKLDFLINLKSCGFDISFDEISKLFLEIPDMYDLKDPGNVVTFIIEYIKFQMIQKDYVKVGELCDRFSKMFPKKVKVLINLYRFALEIKYPSNSIKIFAVLRGVNLGLVEKTEQNFKNRNISDDQRLEKYVLDFGTYISGVRNYCGDKLADEMVGFVKNYVPSFCDFKKDNFTPLIEAANVALYRLQRKELEAMDDLDRIMLELVRLISDNPRSHEEGLEKLNKLEKSVVGVLINMLEGKGRVKYNKMIEQAKRSLDAGKGIDAINLLCVPLGLKNRKASNEIEVKKEVVVDQLFSDEEKDLTKKEDVMLDRLQSLAKRPVLIRKTKKEITNIRVKEGVGDEKMRFLVGLMYCGEEIDSKEVEAIFLSVSQDLILTPESIENYLVTYIQLQILKGNTDKALELSKRILEVYPMGDKTIMNIYKFILYRNFPGASQFREMVLNAGIPEEELEFSEKKSDVFKYVKDSKSYVLLSLKRCISTLRKNNYLKSADEVEEFAGHYVKDFVQIPQHKLELESLRRSVLRCMPWSEYYDFERSRLGLENTRMAVLSKLEDRRKANLPYEDELVLLTEIFDAIMTIQIDEILKLRKSVGLKPLEGVGRKIRQLEMVANSGYKYKAIKEFDLMIEQQKILVDTYRGKKTTATVSESIEDIASIKINLMVDEFYIALEQMNEVRARSMLDKLKVLLPLKRYTELEEKLLSLNTFRSRPKGNSIWLDMADRRPVNKLAFRVSDRYKKDQSEDDE